MKDDRRYYYALYYAIAHLAAYVAILVLIITIGLLISTASTPMPTLSYTRSSFVVFAFFALMCGDLYCIRRMKKLGDIILEGLPHNEIPGLLSKIEHPRNLNLSYVVTVFFTAGDIVLVLKISWFL